MSNQIAYRYWSAKSGPWYVANLKGVGGKDWGYTDDVTKAIVLNTPQWRSFAKDMRECGSAAFALVQEA